MGGGGYEGPLLPPNSPRKQTPNQYTVQLCNWAVLLFTLYNFEITSFCFVVLSGGIIGLPICCHSPVMCVGECVCFPKVCILMFVCVRLCWCANVYLCIAQSTCVCVCVFVYAWGVARLVFPVARMMTRHLNHTRTSVMKKIMLRKKLIRP